MDGVVEGIVSADRLVKIEIHRRPDGTLRLFTFYWYEENVPEYDFKDSGWIRMPSDVTIVDTIERARARAQELIRETPRPTTIHSSVIRTPGFKLVFGYVPRIDRWPAMAKRLALPHRCAFVLDTYKPGNVDMFFDGGLYTEIIRVVWSTVQATAAELIGDDQDRRISCGDDFDGSFRALAPDPVEPLRRVVFEREGRVVAIAESEPWTNVGGPDVYHDSYTIAVFSAADIGAAIESAANAVAARRSLRGPDTVHGEAEPPAGSLNVARLLDALRSLFR
jgi:hypothetical protein